MDVFFIATSAIKIIGLIFLVVMPLVAYTVYAERRVSAAIQDRVGPNRAGIDLFGKRITVLGLMHPVADAIKMITKEDTMNIRVDRLLYNLAPIISLIPALVTFAVVPFGPDIHWGDAVLPLQVARLDAGALYVFAVSSLAVFGVTLVVPESGVGDYQNTALDLVANLCGALLAWWWIRRGLAQS